MTTTFALVATYQYYENYAFDADGSPLTGADAHWKPKGGHEAVIATGITVAEASSGDVAHWKALIAEHGPKDNDVCEFGLIDWELVALDSALVEEVREFVESHGSEDPGYVEFCWGNDKGTEYAFAWACEQLAGEIAEAA